jgi:NAD(P)-dependent dehydrogenase (short-subunit alcohol dehydrogenase family)
LAGSVIDPSVFAGLHADGLAMTNLSAMGTTDTRSAERPLEGKVAVVTGALGLLGREHCRALADAGARVVLTDVDAAACARVAPEFGKGALGIGADITSEGSVKALRDQVLAAAGRIDVLVNNAAINDKFEDPAKAAEQSRFEGYPVSLFRQSLEVNVTGTFLCAQVLGTEMARAGQGASSTSPPPTAWWPRTSRSTGSPTGPRPSGRRRRTPRPRARCSPSPGSSPPTGARPGCG